MSEILQDPFGAFVPDGILTRRGAELGVLSSCTFAAKDLLDVEGTITTAGNPIFGAHRGHATRTAQTVKTLLAAGATLIGKTATDEFAFGINGMNHHTGTVLNPAAAARATGGSSGGSAAAVAGRLCDFSLGTDTGGSVRIPASYCGLLGIRPTHGRVSDEGVWPLAPSLDSVGWFARDAALFSRIGEVLLKPAPSPIKPRRLLIAKDAFALLDSEYYAALAPEIDKIKSQFAHCAEIDLKGPFEDISVLRQTYREIQGFEAWVANGSWIGDNWQHLGADVAERFRMASEITQEQLRTAQQRRVLYQQWINEQLSDSVICLPSTLSPGPNFKKDLHRLDRWRLETLCITTAAPLACTPQVSLPLATVQQAPIGIGLMGAQGADEYLLSLAASLMETRL